MSKPAAAGGRTLAFAAVIFLCGCATAPNQLAPDPLERINRVTATMNGVVQHVVAEPAAKAYVTVTPEPVQEVIHNFFQNLEEPWTVINDLLQGKFKQAGSDSGRFLVNSTFGILGLFDVASQMGLPRHDEDLGQTLAVWGVPSGPYLVLPVLGPSTLRAGVGRLAKAPWYPLSASELTDVSTRNAIFVIEGVDAYRDVLDLQERIDEAYDPYVFIRDAWLQHRKFLIYDGNPPIPDYPELPQLDGG